MFITVLAMPHHQVPLSFIATTQQGDPTSFLPTLLRQRTRPQPLATGCRPGFVRLHTALPPSLHCLPLHLPPSPGAPGHTHLPPLCLPICLHSRMSPFLHQPVCAPPSGPGERGLYARDCYLFSWGKVQNGSYSGLPVPGRATVAPPHQDQYLPLR